MPAQRTWGAPGQVRPESRTLLACSWSAAACAANTALWRARRARLLHRCQRSICTVLLMVDRKGSRPARCAAMRAMASELTTRTAGAWLAFSAAAAS